MPVRHTITMDLRHLRYFAAAVEHGSLQGAAEKLNVAQPALSRRVRDLELELGCDLLERGPRGVTPTPAGLAFHRDISRLLEELGQAAQRARRIGLEHGRGIRMGLATSSARKYAFLGAAHGSAASIAYTRGLSATLVSGLRDGALDVALLYEHRPDSPHLGNRLIHRERYVLAAHPAHPLARPGPATLAEIATHALVWLARADLPGGLNPLAVQLRRQGLDPMIGQLVDSPDEQVEIALASCGACLTPASTIIATPPGQLAFRALPGLDMAIDLTLAWRNDAPVPVQALLNELNPQIDRHQAAIAATADWTRLDGTALYALPT
ncbi:MAG: LysR family transcriptional regulator [Sphingomonadales bacterium]|nr:LysR family transcriptional regulator [Sphingomonadales bacterium]